jgi:hypothetical protein
MSFVNPYFLVGLAAIAVPILIHLLTRDRVRRVAFSTIRFFSRVSKKVLRRKRFREMLLLAMRAAACGLLALAFARPLLEAKDANQNLLQAGTARVILVDMSASMGRAGMAAAAAKEAADALASLAAGSDAAALIAFADAPRVEAPLAKDFADIRAQLKELAPGAGGTDLVEALRKADALLGGVAAQRKEIVLISDLQRVGWRTFKGDWKLAPDVRLSVRPVAPAGQADDLAIIEADCPASTALDGLPRAISVRVANYSAAEKRDVEVTLAIAGKKVDSQKVHIRAGDSVPVRFRHVFTTPGDNPGTVTVAGTDAAPQNNVYYFNARVIPRIRVVLISGRPAGPAVLMPAGGAEVLDPAFFIEKALAPAPESPFLVKRVGTAQAAPADIEGAQVAILADVRDLPGPVLAALGDLLRRGGGILWLPGGQVDADGFNRALADLAPCKLKGIVRPASASGEAPGAALAKVDFEHPVFEVFQHPHYGDLSLPRFRQYWEVTDSQLARVLARFDDGRPAVLERQIGAGVSVLMASPLDLRWSNFPLRAVFLPYLHQMVRYLAVRSEKRTAYQVGETLPAGAPAEAAGPGGTVTDPKGETHTGPSGAPAGRAGPAAVPGFYRVAGAPAAAAAGGARPNGGPGGAEPFQVAVNGDLSEADPAVLSAEELAAAVINPEGAIAEAREAAGPAPSGGRPADRDRDKNDRGFWWYIVLAVAVLAVAELFVANRTLRH